MLRQKDLIWPLLVGIAVGTVIGIPLSRIYGPRTRAEAVAVTGATPLVTDATDAQVFIWTDSKPEWRAINASDLPARAGDITGTPTNTSKKLNAVAISGGTPGFSGGVGR